MAGILVRIAETPIRHELRHQDVGIVLNLMVAILRATNAVCTVESLMPLAATSEMNHS